MDSPYDIVIRELLELDEDIDRETLCQMCVGKLDPEPIKELSSLPDPISKVVVNNSLRNLHSMMHLQGITNIIKSNITPREKMDRIYKLEPLDLAPTISRAKWVSSFEVQQDHNIFNIFNYPVSKGELVLLAAYTKRGKTTIMLSLLKQAVQQELDCLYLSIADWTPSMLRARLEKARTDIPDFKTACYPEADIRTVEMELDQNKPDVLFLDYLGVVSAHNDEGHRHELREITKSLKRLAGEHEVLIVTAHQLNRDSDIPEPEHLSEAKVGILANVDLGIGIGGDPLDSERVANTWVVRHHPPQGHQYFNLDFREFDINENE